MKAPSIPKNEAERLADLIALDLSNSNKAEQLDNIVTILSKCLNVPIAYVSSIESKQQKIHSACGINTGSTDRSTSFCGHTILQNEIFIVEDTHRDERFFDNPMVTNDPKIRFYAGFPLTSLLGNNVGALCIADTVTRKLDDDELNIFKIIGKLLIERLRMHKLGSIQSQIQASKDQLRSVNKQLKQSNKFYEKLFGRYMSESLLNRVMNEGEQPKIGGEEKYVTILMSDLRSFSPLSEKYEASVIVDILNLYFEEMISIIHGYDGYINEILGDGILVVFGAPKPVGNCAKKAIECAREMQKAMKKINNQLLSKKLPSLEMGIGINSGHLIVGNIGSKKRMKYGVVGETVNIAARIESLAIPNQILISESTFEKNADWIQPIGHIRAKIKGFKDPITIYDVSELP
ncbi:GAF domain-containing protein [Leptobacterium flavescens]|uniref:GAF domain-containing protein n=1 Tax=Leptobacterium flavescens TaxID=472055 RepID=A0A6P0UU55_9FLAO|nr:adenylate/guanylate cyclase domain-containing protein [Leptobacterium flavescens]NER13956.1 GAF domain-containing protein [Leptobacterium flavescens]